MRVVKAHAYGNDFLIVAEADLGARDPAAVARAACERHTGVGADGLIVYRPEARGVRMRLFNADGSRAELSGNGLRCLAAWLVRTAEAPGTCARPGTDVSITTDAGEKHLRLVGVEDGRYTFRAAMGPPEEIAERDLEVAGERVRVVTLRVGNPQCVVLDEVAEQRFVRLAPALAAHPAFPAGTNVEFASLEAPDRLRIRIWERGVGPTRSSGTGACAAAAAAVVARGAARTVVVEAPGGAQRVEWREDGLYLTGWAVLVLTGEWQPPPGLA